MNKLFKRLNLPLKLALIGLVPLIFIIYLAIQVQDDKQERLGVLEQFRESISITGKVAFLIDKLQDERRLSFKYVIDTDNRSALDIERRAVDDAIAELQNQSNRRFGNFRAYTLLNDLDEMRSLINEARISPEEVMNYFTNAIFRLNSVSTVFTANIPYLEPVSKDLRAMRALSDMITRLGVSRGIVYYALDHKQDASEALKEVADLRKVYNSFEQEFFLKGSDSAIAAYRLSKSGGALRSTLTMLEHSVANGSLDTGFTAEEWWTISAQGVDELKSLQQAQVRRIIDNVQAIYDKENSEKDRDLVILVVLVAFIISIVFYTLKNVSDSLTGLRVAAQKLAIGESGLKLDIPTNDVIGSLAASIAELDQSSKELAAAADAIGKGDFDVHIEPRSEGDILGNAILHMKNSLHEFTAANEETIWVQQGVAAVNNSISGERDMTVLTQNALNALVSYLKAELGLFYISRKDVLEYAAGYAVESIQNIPRQIKHGETLAGQAAMNKEIMDLRDIPEGALRVTTSSAATKPRHLILVPLVHNDITEGVIEIGTIYGFNKAAVQLLRQVAENIAIAIHAARNRERLQELLEETQSQSEELQAQHNELENINAELEAQAQRLQTSEEELKVQQEELLHANQELEENARALEERNQLIVERNQEIQKRAEELALATKYKSEFLANMSHELRTPLNSILLLSRLLSENNEKNLTSEQIEFARVIQSSGNGLLTLIDEILDLSKIEAGKMDLEYGIVPVKEMMNDMKSLFEPLAKDKQLDFNVDIAPGTPFSIETDRVRLEQILKNLLSNALKFTSAGHIDLHVHAEDHWVVFKVKDTGIGIAQEKQQLVFEAFQQADGSTRRKYGGTGLGLSISRELARLLSGDISLSSTPGQGTEFVVRIPATRPQALPQAPQPTSVAQAQAEEVQQPGPVAGTSYTTKLIPADVPDDRHAVSDADKTILIIEDDVNFAKALLDYTRQQGYKGLVAVRGDEGIELAKQFIPAGILLDIMLPVKDGWQVMEELKSNPLTRHIPVHIMSSNEFKRESLAKGAVNFINKPVAFEQMEDIFKKLEKVLSREHKKVMIVEENPRHAKALAYFLESFDVSTEIKHSINDGVAALAGDSVDCVILDMGIPDQKAYEMLEEVKKNPGLEHLPIIVFTGKSLSKSEESKIRQYADSIVVKTAHSYKRILDEVSLFLHLMEENKKPSTEQKYHRLGALTEVLENKTVLIADDDVRNIYSLTKALENMKMNVITAIDGKEALKQLEANPDVDIVLMDMMMPEMDGYETTTQIRKNRKYKNLPVIAVTAKAMTGDREKCINAGASDYITKPVDIDQLLSLLRVWLYDKGF